ncbi:hypothetical protein BJX96DRAFT_114295 [Aspergillus floccosus]
MCVHRHFSSVGKSSRRILYIPLVLVGSHGRLRLASAQAVERSPLVYDVCLFVVFFWGGFCDEELQSFTIYLSIFCCFTGYLLSGWSGWEWLGLSTGFLARSDGRVADS